MAKLPLNRKHINPGNYVQIKTGTVHLVISIDNDYICIRTLKGDIWISKTEVVSFNSNHK